MVHDLKAEKDELTEIEPQIPLARQLQMMRVDVGNFMPWSEMVRKYAMNHNMDLTTAAFDIVKILEAFGELETIRNEIKKSEAYWSALCENTREYQRAIADLKYLRLAGCGKRDFKKLGEIIRGQRLDNELISNEELGEIGYRINGKKYHIDSLQQPKNNPQQLNGSSNDPNDSKSNNNGYDGPSMRDYVRLTLSTQKY